MITALEWTGAILGLMDALLLATNTRVSKYGWFAFFSANLASIGFSLGIQRYGLFVQQ
ncbi:hypothetical protein HNR39_004558 [Glaciimonas immobilis]|uniref:Nicotinamide riboside transporter PnuC n=1 Tax=Glaciimonas immobilis TaxID=728004 RepID=A0A840S006_9BURK|nr:hypothetical protein [Glaciimonas immobilis]KAF3995911.1 hypothetical protein HAV38_21450 [Glaciimonas immobilis]MBB5202688.1 hypothetical protein [Glaciimonas immobilis]